VHAVCPRVVFLLPSNAMHNQASMIKQKTADKAVWCGLHDVALLRRLFTIDHDYMHCAGRWCCSTADCS